MNKVPPNFSEAIRRLMEDEQPVLLQITKIDAFQVCTGIQLACRHPAFQGPTRKASEAFARTLLQELTANDNDLRQMAAMGWHKEFDHVLGPLFTRPEIEFLLWALGFAEGYAREAGAVIRNSDTIRKKLLSAI
jgi:hypothetical protein